MYYVLCLCLCSAMVWLVGMAGALLVLISSPPFLRLTRNWMPENRARAIWVLRLFPICAGILVTLGLVLPAFVLHEPARTNESLEPHLIILAAMGAALLLSSGYRVVRALIAVTRSTQRWMGSCLRRTRDEMGLDIFEVTDPNALIVITGIFKPAVFVSQQVAHSLTEAERAAAIAHERAHASSGDNLKQLLLHAFRIPLLDRLTGLGTEWQLSSELAADEAALRSGVAVLDLAAALLKVARLRLERPLLEQSIASYFVSPGKNSLLTVRIQRLMEMIEGDERSLPAPKRDFIPLWPVLIGALGAACLTHSYLLVLTYEFLEKLV